jgi:nitrate/nitrite-specific signal transduction histidine kinase
LRWLAIVVPVVFLTGLWTLLHSVFFDLHRFPEVLVVLGVMSVAVGVFAYGVFAVINRLELRLLEQNVELEQRNNELSALLSVGWAASSSLEMGELLDAAMDATMEVVAAEAAEVWLRENHDELVLVRHRGVEEDAFREITRLRFGEGLPGLTAQRAETIIVDDLPADDRFARQAVRNLGFESYCGVPLRHHGNIVGVLGIASFEPLSASHPHEIRLLEGVGERLATGIVNARLHEQVLDGAVVEERLRIARELHDGLAQVLGYINTQTLAVQRLLARGRIEEARAELAAMEKAARAVYGDVREAIVGLRIALPRQGLIPALEQYLRVYEGMAGVELRLEAADGIDELEIPIPTEIQLIRIVQEALSNVRKHAHAVHAVVAVGSGAGCVTIEVSDDGVGFDPGGRGQSGWPRFGLQTMRERAQSIGGTFVLESGEGAGTRVLVRVPLSVSPREVSHAGSAR